MAPSESDDQPVHLLQRRLVVVGPEGVNLTAATVHCPITQSAQAMERCAACARRTGQTSLTLECVVPRRVMGLTERCGDLVPRDTLVLDAELPVPAALELMQAAQVTSAPVIDDNHLLLGVTRVSSLTALAHEADAEVEDAVSDTVAANEALTVPELAKLMATRDLDRVAVVNEAGLLLGVVTALDVVRWFSDAAADERDRRGRCDER